MPRRDHKKLQLELLESRVMLSAGDQPQNASADVILHTAIHASGLNSDTIDVHFGASDWMLIIQGPGNGNVTLDLSALPDSVTSLQISSFSSVTLIGDHSVDNLVLKNIAFVDAGRISIGASADGTGPQVGLFASNVERIRIDVGPRFISLSGSQESIGGRTLLEVGHFTEGAVIVSRLDSLGIAANSSVDDLIVYSFNPKQTVLLNFQPGTLHIGDKGFDSSSQVSVVTGDLPTYFFASTSERTNLEQSHLVARQAAVTNLISLSSLLNNPTVQAALGGIVDSGANLQNTRNRTNADTDFAHSVIGLGLLGEAMTSTGGSDTENSAHRGVSGADGFTLSSSLEHTDLAQGHVLADSSEGSAADAGAKEVFGANSDNSAHADDAVTASVAAALSRLTEPFARTMFDLRDRFTTYGDLASAHVSDQVRTDRQPALLVNARVARQTDDKEILVVTV